MLSTVENVENFFSAQDDKQTCFVVAYDLLYSDTKKDEFIKTYKNWPGIKERFEDASFSQNTVNIFESKDANHGPLVIFSYEVARAVGAPHKYLFDLAEFMADAKIPKCRFYKILLNSFPGIFKDDIAWGIVGVFAASRKDCLIYHEKQLKAAS